VPPSPAILTFDLDGVLCRPPFGINPGRGRGKERAGEGTRNLLWRTERWRYALRRPMPGARDGLALLQQSFECHVLSARALDTEGLTARWFERYFGFVPVMHLRPDWREKPAQFKVRILQELAPLAHFEDDPHTAEWVAEFLPAVFLVDWWRNRWLQAERVHRIHQLSDALPTLHQLAESRSPAAD